MLPIICLASVSPRRHELLQQLGVAHIVSPAQVDETPRDDETPMDYVLRLSREKASRVFHDPARSQGLPVLGADTTVVANERILGKPADFEESRAMLTLLSGRVHSVLSAVSLITSAGLSSRLSMTVVRFRAISDAEIEAYWATGEPCDKAGAYAIQGIGAAFVESIAGSYSGVMGLPLFETSQLLVDAGLPLWHRAP